MGSSYKNHDGYARARAVASEKGGTEDGEKDGEEDGQDETFLTDSEQLKARSRVIRYPEK